MTRAIPPAWLLYTSLLTPDELRALSLYYGLTGSSDNTLTYAEVAELMRDPAINTLKVQVLVSSAISKLRSKYERSK